MTRAAGEGRSLPSTPANPHARTSQHGLLLLSRADEAADALDDLALRIHLLFSRLLAQEDGGNWKASRNRLVTAPGKAAALSPTHCPRSGWKGGDRSGWNGGIHRKQTPHSPHPLSVCLRGYVSESPSSCPFPWALVSPLSNEDLGPHGLGVPSGSNVLKACG